MTQRASWAIRLASVALAVVVGLVAPVIADDTAKAADEPVAADAEAKDSEAEAKEGHDKEGHDKEGHDKDGSDHKGHDKAGSDDDGHDKAGHEGDGDHGENPHDLSHSNALPSQEAPEEWKFDLAIYTFVVFVLLMGILLKFAWGPIMGALDEREGRVAQLIDDAEKSAVKAKQELAAYESKLSEAHVEAEEIVNRATQSAQEQADKILADAKESSDREKTRALAEIEQAKNEALGEVTQKSVDIALGLARSVVGREIRAEDHESLINEALEKFPS